VEEIEEGNGEIHLFLEKQTKELRRAERELAFLMEFPLVPILALVANTEASEKTA